MPKAFDPSEKLAIRAALMAAGLRHFERLGIRAARVDDICRDVGIAKGSFYAFFPSKEDLFMAITEEREQGHRRDMLALIETAPGTPAERAGQFFDVIVRKMETDPVLNLVLASGEIPHLMRKLGAERFVRGEADDRAVMIEAARRWSEVEGRPVDVDDLLGLMTIALCLTTQRGNMPGGQYPPAVALLRELFIDRLTRRAS